MHEHEQHHGAEVPRDFVKKQKVTAYCIRVILFISLGSTSYGYSSSIIATTLSQPSFTKSMHLDTASNAASLTGAMNGVWFAGGVVGGLIAGWFSSTYGRKLCVAVGVAMILITSALLTASVNAPMFIVFRFFNGWGAYQTLSQVPVWIAELSPPQVRGVLVDLHAFLMLCGYLLAAYMGLAFYFVSGANQWRGAMGIQMVCPAIVLAGIYWMPESPRYLLSKDRTEEAWQVVQELHSTKDDPEKEFAKREFYQMRRQIEFDSRLPSSYLDILKRPSLRRRALMTILLEVCNQSSGILVILNYGSIIYRTLGFNNVQILNLQGGFQLTGAIFGLLALTFVDRVSRPKLIGIALLSCAATLAVLTGLQSTYLGTDNKGGLIACVVMIYLFQAIYAGALDGAAFYYVAEIWPTHLRSKGLGIAVAALCAIDIVYLQCAPLAFDNIGWKYFLVFIFVPAAGAVYIWWTYPDTLHKPLEEIAAMFGDEDMVMVYQRDLDSAEIPLDAIERDLPGNDKGLREQVVQIEQAHQGQVGESTK
ncbi:hypothetical protein CLAIMM_03754 [Cladophialophora immunda]|nr:hypothetical protein CLAIMM_03754 [Cladophialophora immunda]